MQSRNQPGCDTMPQMSARRFTSPLALLAVLLVLSQVSSRVVFAWFCEGRMCGATPVFCCCTSPNGETRDAKCEDGQQSASEPQASLCPSGCECEMAAIGSVEKSPATVASTPLLPSPPLAVLPAAFRLTTPVLTFAKEPAYAIDVRGPPASPVRFSANLLRAPPHS
jgi:hypothetical protein